MSHSEMLKFSEEFWANALYICLQSVKEIMDLYSSLSYTDLSC